MTNITTGTTNTALHDIFSKHGLADILVFDNDSQFTAREIELTMLAMLEFCIVHQQCTNHPWSWSG